MSELAPVSDFGLARLRQLEQRIVESEQGGLHARWAFGRELLTRVDDKGNLPRGFVRDLAVELDVQPSEINRRKLFALRFPTEVERDHAVITYGSWHTLVNKGLPALREDGEMPTAPLPEGVYRTIVADPPWQYANKATRGAAEDHYATMTIEELCALDVVGRAADEGHLYLWTTNGFLREAFQVLDAWGFTYKTTLVWVKPQIGMGNYFRSSTEYVLFGVRGGLRTLDCNQRNWFEAPRRKHSEKPGAFFDLVEKVSPGPYLEMFARVRRLGWDAWGNEA